MLREEARRSEDFSSTFHGGCFGGGTRRSKKHKDFSSTFHGSCLGVAVKQREDENKCDDAHEQANFTLSYKSRMKFWNCL
jgi:hypothetical protein